MSVWLINPPSSGTLAFSLRLAPSLPAADSPAFHTVLGPCSGLVMLCSKPLVDHDIEELQNLVTALQLEFATLYTMQVSAIEGDSSAGYWSLVNTEDVCVRIRHTSGACYCTRDRSLS